jgi:hypothetical protein
MSSSLTPSQIAMNVARLLPANQLLIDLQGGPVIQAFIMEDFAYALGNTWESMWEELMGTAASTIQMGQQFMASLTHGEFGQVRLQSVTQTIAQWHGSERISFTLPLVFVATDNTMDVLNPVLALNRLSLPVMSAGAGGEALLITSPSFNGQGFSGNPSNCTGGVGFAYGQWFRTPPWFVVRKWNPTLSKAAILGSDGNQRPVMAAGVLQIEAYRTIFANEFNSWFVSEPTNLRTDAGGFIAQNTPSWN